jgi:DNA repair exonuclease SbcCD ATPase subunit
MRRVNIQEVGMENFGPYLDPMILEFKNDSIVLMTGPNGVGKTMALDAITFTLYGLTSKGAKGDDVVNNVVGKNCKTWVKFDIDGEVYVVTRLQKYKGKNTVVLNKGNVDIKKGHKEVLPEIEKLICSRRSFMNTLMFGQKVKDFFTDLVDSDKKMIFREILALELYESYYKEANKRLKAVKTEMDAIEKQQGINHGLNEDANQQIAILLTAQKRYEQEKKDAITEIKKSIDTSQRLLEVWQAAFKALEKEDVDVDLTVSYLTKVEKELGTIQSTLDNELQSIEQQRTNKLLEMKNIANEAKTVINKKFRENYDRIAKEKAELKETLNDLVSTAQTRRHKLELKIENVESDIRNWQERSQEIQDNVIDAVIAECPMCEQEVTEDTTKMLKIKVSDYNTSMDQGLKTVSSLQEQIKELNADMIKGSEDIKRFIANHKIENEESVNLEIIEIQQLDLRLINATQKVNQLADGEKSKKEIAIAKVKSDLEESQLALLSKKEDQDKAIESRNDTATKIENLKKVRAGNA